MANSFDFELTASDQASAAIMRIEDVVKNLNPLLDKTRDSLELGGQDSRDNLDDLNKRFDVLSRNAREGVQFISDLVPPLKMVGGLTLGLGGAAAAVNIVKNNMVEFANAGYRIDTIAKNISMTTDAFQELTGAMIENGSAREDAEGSITDLFDKATAAAYGENAAFLAVLNAKGIGISKTKEGLADVGKLVKDINEAMQNMSSGEQALFIKKLSLSPDMLSLLRNTTTEVQRLKDQARRDGLIFNDADIQHALSFRQQLNQIEAAYDGILMKGQSWLGQSEALRSSVDQIKQITAHGLDSATVGSILTFNRGGKQADLLRRAGSDDEFKNTLSWKEGLDLKLGYASGDLIKKLNSFYGPSLRAEQLYSDMNAITGRGTVGSIVPYNQAGNNSLGIRNNNPGNLRSAPNSTGKNGGFVTFNTSMDGNSAMARQLMLYGDRGNNTLNGIIHTYAPAKENNTQAYINDVANKTGFSPDSRLDLHSPDVLEKLMAAMIHHENGSQPYSLENIRGAINNAIFDPKWSSKRDNRFLNDQQRNWPGVPRDKQDLDNNNIQESSGGSIYSPLNDRDGDGVNQKLVSALKDLNQTMQDSKMKVELTLVDQKTGERKTFTGQNGGRVSETYELQ
ncbi:hypothetical protein [Erwinia sp. S38]|uniref:hypothetical protein n=1 Tax=Erwinia sp. S38 TaxID=2769338 RepID=UPI00190E2C44|nr:hypothetical protein [Erwinia sp. S38]MBK0004382.1 hypothetical protein [Erwinia sp. S38]